MGGQLIKRIKSIYREANASVKVDGELSDGARLKLNRVDWSVGACLFADDNVAGREGK